MGVQFGSQSGTETVNLRPEDPRERRASAISFDLIDELRNLASQEGGLGRLASQIEQIAGSLGEQQRGLPDLRQISAFVTGTEPTLREKSRQLSQPVISQARSELDDFLRTFSGSSAAGAGASGVAGSSAARGRLLGGVDIGARRLADVVSQTAQQFNPLALGQSIGAGLGDLRTRNIQSLGSLFQIGSQLFGQRGSVLGAASDVAAREASRFANLRLGSSPRETTGTSVQGGIQL